MKLIKLAVSLLMSFVAGAIGSLVTFPNLAGWYAVLDKPSFTPPNWVFGPVWTLLYVMMGVAFYLVWTSQAKGDKTRALLFFGIQLGLNTLWSVVFFGLHAPWAAVIVIVALLVLIGLTAREFHRFSKLASVLLLPYAAWVAFATALTLGVARLN